MDKRSKRYGADEENGLFYFMHVDPSSTSGKTTLKRLTKPSTVCFLICCFVASVLIFGTYNAPDYVITNLKESSSKYLPYGSVIIGNSTFPSEEEEFRDEDSEIAASAKSAQIGIATLNFGHGGRHSFKAEKGRVADLYGRSYDLLSQYSKKWGYPLSTCGHLMISEPLQAERKGLMTKEALVMSVILTELQKPDEEDRLKWVYFMDADTIIMNHNVPLETFVPPETDEVGRRQILIAAFDQWNTLNSGAFLMRVSEDSVRFLSTMMATAATLDPEIWRGSDQALMAITAKLPTFVEKVSIVPAHWFNSDAFGYFVPDSFDGNVKTVYQYGDFMIHFMGGGKYKTGWYPMVEAASDQTNTTIAPSLESTRYQSGPDTVEEFWKIWLSKSAEEREETVRSCIDVTVRKSS